MIRILQENDIDVDPNEHVIAVFDKALEHLQHLDRDKFKDKVKDIRKKTNRVLIQLQNKLNDEDRKKLEEEVTNYFDRFEEFWSKKRRSSSVSVTAEESLTEGVL